MSLANALKKAASKTLSKLGGNVTIRKVTTGSYNATTGNDLDYVPTTKDRVVISSVEFKIIAVNTNEQNNTPISFEIVLR